MENRSVAKWFAELSDGNRYDSNTMNDPSITNLPYQSLTDQQLSVIDALCDRFDQELLNGQSPRIEIFLADAPETCRDGLLAELLGMKVEHLIQQGCAPQHDEYVKRFPQQQSIVDGVFARNAATLGPGEHTIAIPVIVPPVVANFRLIEEIGRGGMGVVWLAEQVKPVKRLVALKLIKSELTSKEVLARFDAEKQALAMMDHPNIASVLDAGTADDGCPYFVMELVDGVSITQYCDFKKLSVAERLKLFVPVCKAVQHAHEKGIVHRDLKPSNVLVTVIDGEAVPKVIDFGLAKVVAQNLQLTDETMRTDFGRVIGTVQYMSPEQAELNETDAQNIDARTDVYSLGVMLYELLTGSTPLDKETIGRNELLKILQLIREVDPKRPSNRLSSSSHEVNSVVSKLRRLHPARLQQVLREELDWVVMKALEIDRTRRYQTANDLAQDLINYLTGKAVTARPPSTWYQVQKFARRHRGLVAAMLAIGVVLLSGIVGTTYGLIRANQKADEADDQRIFAEVARANAVDAEARATAESRRTHDSEAAAMFQLAIARWDTNRASDARDLLHQIPERYRDNFEWHFCNRRFQGSDITCYGHPDQVNEVAFTPDGMRVVSAGKSGDIRLWDAKTGKELAKLEGHEGNVWGLAVSPDGKNIASAGQDKTVRLWDTESGELVRIGNGHSGSINCLAFSPTGDQIATASDDKTIKLWDTTTGEEIKTITGHTGEVWGVAFSPDGERLASTSTGGDQSVRIWDSRSGEQIAIVCQGREAMRRMAYSPDGTRLATISLGATIGNYTFSLWDTQTWRLVVEGVEEHDGVVWCVAFSPDGTRFATGGDDSTIKLWDTQSGKMTAIFSGHAKSVWGVAFSPDGSRLASVSKDSTVKIWDVRDGTNELTLRGHSGGVNSVVFSADGKQLASSGGNGSIILRDAQTSEMLFTLKGHSSSVGKLSFNPDGTRLASAGMDKTVRLWDTCTGDELAVLGGHTAWVHAVAFSPDGAKIASAGGDGAIKLWDAQTHEETAALKGHPDGLYCVAFSPDGSLLASAGFDRKIKLWGVRSGEENREFALKPVMTRSVAFSPRGERIVSGGIDSKIRVWDVASGKQITTASSPRAAIHSVAFDPDGKRIAAAGTERAVSLFDASTGKEIIKLDAGGGDVVAVTFSPDGTRLAAARHMGSVRIWDAPRKQESTLLKGHTDTVTRVTFSPDGSRIYSESENEKRVWDVASQEEIQDAMWEPPDLTTLTSPDGRWFVATESLNVVLVDLQYKNTPDEKAWRSAKASFDSFWHEEQATAATTANNWYKAVFHYAWLLKHEPDSMAHSVGLQSSYRRLTAREADEIEALSRLADVTGHHHGTFFTQNKKRVVTTFSATPFTWAKEFTKSPTNESGSYHALYFDGVSYADLGHPHFSQASFTVEGWIKPDLTSLDSSVSYPIFTLRSGESETALAAEVYRDGRLRVIHRNPSGTSGGINFFSQTNITDGTWHHFAIVRDDNSKLHLSIDGSLEASSEETVADFGDTPYPVFLGVSHEKHPSYFKGLMAKVRFWNYARTKEEMISGLNTRINPTSQGLVSAYEFNPFEPGQFPNANLYLAPVVLESLKRLRN
jgi:eukaryotic-like serine/threonine-protein kinase